MCIQIIHSWLNFVCVYISFISLFELQIICDIKKCHPLRSVKFPFCVYSFLLSWNSLPVTLTPELTIMFTAIRVTADYRQTRSRILSQSWRPKSKARSLHKQPFFYGEKKLDHFTKKKKMIPPLKRSSFSIIVALIWMVNFMVGPCQGNTPLWVPPART